MKPTYTPIIKGKRNDLLALGNVPRALARTIVPIVEFAPPNDASKLELGSVRFANQLRKLCPLQRVSVDLWAIQPNDRTVSGTPLLEGICAYLRGLGVPFVPVHGFDREEELWGRILAIAAAQGSGLTIRLEEDEIDQPEETLLRIADGIQTVGISESDVNLIIDFGSLENMSKANLAEISEGSAAFIDKALRFSEFGSLSIVGSSMPPTVGAIPKEGVGMYLRRELALWLPLQTAFPSGSIGFGDYGVVHARSPINRPAPHANGKIRYTAGVHHHVFRGYSLRQGEKYEQYRKLARRVLDSGVYLSPDFSMGDQHIKHCANNLGKPGGLGKWIEVDTNHHLVYVGHQLPQFITSLQRGITPEEILQVD